MRHFSLAHRDPPPFSTMNTTPLIDVLLVLLVMFIITIPAQMHELPIDLPGADTHTDMPPPIRRLEIGRRGDLRWDGAAIAPEALRPRLAALRTDPARPILQIRTDAEARYDAFAQTLSLVKKAGVTRVSFAGNAPF